MTGKKKKQFIILLIFLIAVLLISGKKQEQERIDPSVIAYHLRDGDVILRLGSGVFSSLFREFSLTDNRFSHLGIVHIIDDNIYVIHSVGVFRDRTQGVYKTSLESFIGHRLSIGVFRVQNVDGRFISNKASRYIGAPFDWSFDLSESVYVYCTELLYVILEYINKQHIIPTVFIEQINRYAIPLESISSNPYIDEIIFYALDGSQPRRRWFHRPLLFLFLRIAFDG